MEEAFSQTPGLALVQASAQNIDRVVSILKAAQKTDRKLVIDLYAAAVLEATDNSKIPQSSWSNIVLYVPKTQDEQIEDKGWSKLLKRHSKNRIYIDAIKKNPNKFTLLFRPLHIEDLEQNKCLEGARFIYSLWEGYWDMPSSNDVKRFLKRHNISKQSIHCSGHASLEDLGRMVSAINPAKLVPIHTFMPDKFCELFPNVQM